MNATAVRSQTDRLIFPPAQGLRGSESAPMVRRQRTLYLPGPAGRLEALLNQGTPDTPFAALLCHPHPLGGGTMHNKVVYHAMKAMNAPEWGLGLPVLRFNFRGVGLSEGRHDGGAEAEDVAAALAWLENEYNVPIVAAGFSFGAAMTLEACCGASRPPAAVGALVALGLPTEPGSPRTGLGPWGGEPGSPRTGLGPWGGEAAGRNYSYRFLNNCTLPKLFVSGALDQFAPASQLAQVTASAADPKRLVLLPGADHFFTNQLEPMQQALAGWLKELTP
ncbi:MAG: alpha/beta hydrolase [Terracidiphilus sp.]